MWLNQPAPKHQNLTFISSLVKLAILASEVYIMVITSIRTNLSVRRQEPLPTWPLGITFSLGSQKIFGRCNLERIDPLPRTSLTVVESSFWA